MARRGRRIASESADRAPRFGYAPAPMIPSRLDVSRDSALEHDLDVEERLVGCPRTHTVKGMFFARLVEQAIRAGVRPTSLPLDVPVDDARYVAFRDYPIRDYMRWAAALARKAHPRAAMSEGLRRVAIQDFARFIDSGLGKVMVAFLTDARAVMARSGQLYGMVLKGPTVESEPSDDGIVIRYRDYHGPVECYPLGTLEGGCRHFGARYEIRVEVLSPTAADYHVRLP